VLPHDGGLPSDGLRQRPDDLAQGGFAQDRDIAARGAFGHAELRRKLGGGGAGLGLQ